MAGGKWGKLNGTLIGVTVEPDWRVTTLAYPHGSTVVVLDPSGRTELSTVCMCSCHCEEPVTVDI